MSKFDIYSFEKFMIKMNFKRNPIKKRKTINPQYFDTLIRAAMTFLLLAIDFILFAGSGDLNIFSGIYYSMEISAVIMMFAFFSVILYAAFRKLRSIQDFLVAFTVFLFIYSLYNQFALFDYKSLLASWLGLSYNGIMGRHSDSIIALIFSALAFWFYRRNNRIYIAYLTFLIFVLFFGIMSHKFIHRSPLEEFIVTTEHLEYTQTNSDEGQKAIYIFLPGASSYKTISEWNTDESKQAVDLMLGFYAKNKFELFPNAYVNEKNEFLNFVNILNSQRSDEVANNVLQTKLLNRYWRFFNLSNEFIYLKNNDLFETYLNSGYKVSAYKSHSIDLCHKNHKMNVNRCVEKIGRPIIIYDSDISSYDKIKVIFVEWLESTKMFNNLSGLYKLLSFFRDIDQTPIVGINYNNLYIVNSIHTFDRLLSDMLSDEGNQAYFVYIDIPSDMYIYNEFCEIKPTTEWINKNNLPWVASQHTEKKRIAYLQQTKCLYGKLEEFLQKLKEHNMFDNATITIQGISSYSKEDVSTQNSYTDTFMNNQLVSTAYKDENSIYFKLSENICTTANILNSKLYGNKLCRDLEGVNAHVLIKRAIFSRLKHQPITESYLREKIKEFDEWYTLWKDKNQSKESRASHYKSEENRQEIFIEENDDFDSEMMEDSDVLLDEIGDI